MGTQAEATPREDFYWVDEREPHFQRRKDILKSHPEVTKLFGVNPKLKYVTVALVVVQLTIAVFAHNLPWWAFLLVTFVVGATIAQALFLAIHEITHDLAFQRKLHNTLLAYFANLPIVFPFAMSFKTYHAIHHWDQGKDGEDMDIPPILKRKSSVGSLAKSCGSSTRLCSTPCARYLASP
ncbi:MAG: fatty acid desaturase [Saprospiraceae bacterium]|nr:fatty acid desaturase [Saprospiraceae bacterium]